MTDIQTTSLLLQLFCRFLFIIIIIIVIIINLIIILSPTLMLCAIGLYMYCMRRNTNDCLRLRLNHLVFHGRMGFTIHRT